MKTQRGGLKLKNPGKTGFKPIYDMINSPSCSINLLTYKSLKGFMIYINVSENDSEYIGIQGGKFTKTVSSFLLKFAVITPNNDETLPSYKNIEKMSESKESYFEEAKLQQKIWKTSISGGRNEICPPVANFSLFTNNDSLNLLKFLKNKTGGNVKEIFDYLFTCIKNNKNYGIGIITMPKVENSTTFGDFINLPLGTDFYGLPINDEVINMAYSFVLSKTARLFVDIGVIHFDLHTGNSLIFKTNDNQINSLIIDFGRASDLNSGLDDEYLTLGEKQIIIREKEQFYDRLFRIPFNASNSEKTTYMRQVFNIIADLDYEKNHKMFHYSNLDRYQMDWYDNIPRDPAVLSNAFYLLKMSTEITHGTSSMMPKTIQSYENSGYLINFDTGVDSFVVPFIGANCDEAVDFCVISGGKKRTRKMKKRQSRRNKKSKKEIYNKKFITKNL